MLVHSTAYVKAFPVPVEEDSKAVILDLQAPDFEHQALVVSKGMYWLPQYTSEQRVTCSLLF